MPLYTPSTDVVIGFIPTLYAVNESAGAVQVGIGLISGSLQGFSIDINISAFDNTAKGLCRSVFFFLYESLYMCTGHTITNLELIKCMPSISYSNRFSQHQFFRDRAQRIVRELNFGIYETCIRVNMHVANFLSINFR